MGEAQLAFGLHGFLLTERKVEYVQGGKAWPVTISPGDEIPWRFDPVRVGPSLAMGDIGTHAHNLSGS